MRSIMRRGILFMAATGLCAAGIGTLAFAQQYPERNVTLIVPYGAGGGTDITARMLAKTRGRLGKPVTVENRAGGGGWVGWGALAAAKPDGYILGYLNVPSDVCGLSRPAIQPQGNTRQLHAADEPRARLQCLGGEGGKPVQDRQGCRGGREEDAECDHRHRLRRRTRRSSRDALDARPRPISNCRSCITSTAEAKTRVLGGHLQVLAANISEIAEEVKSGQSECSA